MKSSGLLAASVVLTLVSGALWWSNRKEAKAGKTTTEVTSTKLISTPEDQIQEIKIQKPGTETIDVQKTAGKWQIASPSSLPADQEAVSSLLSNFSSVNSEHLIEDHATSLEQYGLAQPSMKLTLVEANNKTHDLLVGDATPAGSAAYAQLAGDPRVVTIPSYVKSGFEKSVNDLRDKRLMVFETDKVSEIELTAKKETVVFARSKENWQILKPKPYRADRSLVDDLLRTLSDTKMELSAADDEKKIAAAFAAGAPVADAKVTDVSGTKELQVRKNKDDYYAKAPAGIYKVSSSTGNGLNKGLDDFRNKKLFDFGYSDPEKIEIHDGAKTVSLAHNGSDWTSGSTKMDPDSVSTLLDKMRDLSATKFPEGSFGSPAIELSVTSDSGKRVEKVQLAKDKENYLAKRENEPALYEIAASAVTDLQKAALEVKAAAPPPPASAPPKK